MNKHLIIITVLFLSVGACTSVTYAGSAGSDCGFFDFICDDNVDDNGFYTSFFSAGEGASNRLKAAIFGYKVDSAGNIADDLKEHIRDNRAEYKIYLNDNIDADTDYNVLEIEINAKGETESLYLIGKVDNSSWESLSVKEDTNKEVDKDAFVVEGYASANLMHETEEFHDKYISKSDNPKPEMSYLTRLGAQYKGDVKGPYISELGD